MHAPGVQGTSGRKIGELRGHTSSVSHIALDAATNHVFTLSIDKSIKVCTGLQCLRQQWHKTQAMLDGRVLGRVVIGR